MAEKTYAEKYAEQNNVLEKNIAVIRPFLKKISEQYDAGTNFYNDIAILSGPSITEYNHFYENRRDLYNRWQKGEVLIYNVKWAGATFVIECSPINKPSSAYMVYKHNNHPVPLDVAVAIKNLYAAQEYRSILYGCMRSQRNR